MKGAIIYIGIGILASGCAPTAPELQTGDLLFQTTADSPMVDAIRDATGKKEAENFSHVAIFVAGNRADSVLEASTEGGVRMVAWEKFVDRSAKIDGKPYIVAKRLRDTTGVAASVARAKLEIGAPYDYAFRADNGKFYCSELIEAHYKDGAGSPVFTAQPMNFRAPDGTMPAYWAELYARLGEEIPEGEPGTNPNDMARNAKLRTVRRWF